MTVQYKLTKIQTMKVTMATKIYKMSIPESDEEDISIYVRDLSGTCVQY